MLQVRNETPFEPGIFLFPDAQGVDTLYVVVKATFEVGREGPQVAEKQREAGAGGRVLGRVWPVEPEVRQ